ncbi:DUF4870 domain-containing protein [Akkermansiaceae bacterium]|nr:DUF4870 domain-containing protein [Akkermansiaceae bacterium]
MDQLPPAAAQPPSHHSGVPIPERQWGMLAHLSTFSACVGMPLGNILGPLIMFLIKKDEYPFGGDQAKEALNFNISCTLYLLISIALCVVIIGFVLLPILGIFWLVATIIAAVRSNEGVSYRYPLCIRFVS